MAVGTRQKEQRAPVDPETEQANNGSGPVVSEAEAKLLEGLGLTGKIDLSAPVTRRPARTGRTSKMASDERVLRIVRSFEDDLPAARAAFEEETDHYNGFYFIGTNRDFTGAKSVLGTWAKGQAFEVEGTAVNVTVAWDKHASSPNAASTKADDSAKTVIYLASLTIAEPDSDDESGDNGE